VTAAERLAEIRRILDVRVGRSALDTTNLVTFVRTETLRGIYRLSAPPRRRKTTGKKARKR
jgi:hypothetical protein